MASRTTQLDTSRLDSASAPATPVCRLGIDGLPVPRLRGRLHEIAIVPLAAAGIVMTSLAATPSARVALGIFTTSTVAMLVASAAYHCHAHSFERKLATRRLDHAMIYVAIAGAQTAYWMLTAPPVIATTAITAAWVVAGLGIHHKLNRLTLSGSPGNWLYIVLGWTGLAMVPCLIGAGDAIVFGAVVAGGVVYTCGGVILAQRRFDLWPNVFGYHEVWHLMVVGGVVAHFAGLVRLAATAA